MLKLKSRKPYAKDDYRANRISVVLQPRVDPGYWLETHTGDEIEPKLIESKYPVWTGIYYALQTRKCQAISSKRMLKVKTWAFGTETSEKTNILISQSI
jgi:hypothetical protein